MDSPESVRQVSSGDEVSNDLAVVESTFIYPKIHASLSLKFNAPLHRDHFLDLNVGERVLQNQTMLLLAAIGSEVYWSRADLN